MDKKNFIWNSVGSTFNAFTSLFYMIIVTRLNGVDISGIFTFAFSFACLVQVIGIYFGRSYQVTNIDESIKDSDFIYNRFFTCLLMLLFSIIFVFIKGYSKYKIIVIFLLVLYRLVESFGEIIYGVIQKQNRLYQVGISMFLKGLFSVILFFSFDFFTNNLLISIFSITIVNLLFIIFYDLKNAKKCGLIIEKFNRINFKKLLIGGFFVFLFTFLTQYVLNASKYSIDNFLSDKYQTIYGIIVMPATVMALCAQFFVQPFLTEFSNKIKKKDYTNFGKLVFKICLYVFLFGIFALIFCYFFGIPILEFIYGIRLSDYKYCLLLIIGASTFFGISYVISNGLIALRKNFIQTIIYVVVSLLALCFSDFFVKNYEVFGASLAYFILMFILFLLYVLCFVYYIKQLDVNYDYNIHTFVILAYKESPFLEECIKSVLNQSIKSNVVIATTTKNKYICDLAKKYNINVIEGKHTSIGGDFDFAVSVAKSKLVTVAHQDDLYDFNYAEEVINNYYRHKNTLIIFSDYYEIRNEKKVYTNKNLVIKRILLLNLIFKKISGIKFLKRNSLRFGCSICCPAVTFVLDNCPKKIFNSDMKSNVDWYAWEKLSKISGKFIYVNKKIVGHRVDDTTTTTDIINQGIRTKEDLFMFEKFWPKSIAKIINKFYKKSENSNNIK